MNGDDAEGSRHARCAITVAKILGKGAADRKTAETSLSQSQATSAPPERSSDTCSDVQCW